MLPYDFKNIYVLNEKLEKIGMVNKYEALSWDITWGAYGGFAIWAVINEENTRNLQERNLVWTEEDDVGIIEHIELINDDTDNELLKVSGKFITKWLEKRIIWGKLVQTGKVSDVLRQIVSTQVISPTDPKRKLDKILLAEDYTAFGETIQYTSSYGNVRKECEDLCASYGYNYRLRFNRFTRKLEFVVESGRDLSDKVVLDTTLDDILCSNYVKDISSFKNCALIAGAGEGVNRIVTSLGTDTNGLDRDELYVDARDLSDKDQNNFDIPREKYLLMLQERGKSKLADHPVYLEYFADINVNNQSNFVFGKDYKLGDIVKLVDRKLGISVLARIITYSRDKETNALSVSLVVGTLLPTLRKLINERE